METIIPHFASLYEVGAIAVVLGFLQNQFPFDLLQSGADSLQGAQHQRNQSRHRPGIVQLRLRQKMLIVQRTDQPMPEDRPQFSPLGDRSFQILSSCWNLPNFHPYSLRQRTLLLRDPLLQTAQKRGIGVQLNLHLGIRRNQHHLTGSDRNIHAAEPALELLDGQNPDLLQAGRLFAGNAADKFLQLFLIVRQLLVGLSFFQTRRHPADQIPHLHGGRFLQEIGLFQLAISNNPIEQIQGR